MKRGIVIGTITFVVVLVSVIGYLWYSDYQNYQEFKWMCEFVQGYADGDKCVDKDGTIMFDRSEANRRWIQNEEFTK